MGINHHGEFNSAGRVCRAIAWGVYVGWKRVMIPWERGGEWPANLA